MLASLVGAEETDGSVGYITVQDEFCGVGVGGGLDLFHDVAHSDLSWREPAGMIFCILILKVDHLQCVHVSGKKICGPESLARV
jgi:hypothetical protein